MTIILNTTGNPINREERIKINQNWDKIIGGLTDIQYQINVLAGGENVALLLQEIKEAIRKANVAEELSKQAYDESVEATKQANEATQKANDAVDRSNEAIQKAEIATAEAIEKIAEVSALLFDAADKLEKADQATKDANKATENATTATEEIKKLQIQLEQDLVLVAQAITDANNATDIAVKASEAINGWGTATVWNATTYYEKNNIVTDNGSTWQANKPNNNSKPSTTNTNWILLAQRGIDGTGAVSSVNGRLPNEEGEVTVTASDLGDFSGTSLKDGTVSLEKLGEDVQDAINNAGSKIDIIDNLESERSDAVLSAKQGKVLKELSDSLGNKTGEIEESVTNLEQTIIQNKEEVTEHLAQIASKDKLGHVKVGKNLTIDPDGTLNATASTSIEATKSNLDWYVDPNGNDETGNGTSAKPFRTIIATLMKLPKIINHTVTIKVKDGDYNEDVRLEGFFGSGTIILTGTSTTANCRVLYVSVINCSIKATITKVTVTGQSNAVEVLNSFYAYLYDVSIIKNATSTGVVADGSRVHLSSCVISNKDTALAAYGMSNVFLSSCSGNDNKIVLVAHQSSTIVKNGVPSGTTAENTTTGGLIR